MLALRTMPASEEPRIDERDMFAPWICVRPQRFPRSEGVATISEEMCSLGHVSLLLTAVSDALLRNSHDPEAEL